MGIPHPSEVGGQPVVFALLIRQLTLWEMSANYNYCHNTNSTTTQPKLTVKRHFINDATICGIDIWKAIRGGVQKNFKARGKLDRVLCLSRTKNFVDNDSRGFESATSVDGPATLRLSFTTCLNVRPGEPGVPQNSKACETLRTLKNHTTYEHTSQTLGKFHRHTLGKSLPLRCSK